MQNEHSDVLRHHVTSRKRVDLMCGGGLVHQSLHCDAHFHQTLLFQDVMRKTQFVLGDQSDREGGMVETEKKGNR